MVLSHLECTVAEMPWTSAYLLDNVADFVCVFGLDDTVGYGKAVEQIASCDRELIVPFPSQEGVQLVLLEVGDDVAPVYAFWCVTHDGQ